MNPLKQGLKLDDLTTVTKSVAVFIHESIKTRVETSMISAASNRPRQSLSMNPLKQGLKRNLEEMTPRLQQVFIHESIKTRVETVRAGRTR